MRLTKAEKAEQEAARETLRGMLPPGSTVYTVLRHVSRSRMMREISLAAVTCQDSADLVWLTGYAARAMGERIGRHDGIRVSGCGMDMGFHLVYRLSRYLYPDGHGCIGAGCPSNDHSNGDRDYRVHNAALAAELEQAGIQDRAFAEHWHRDGGYALRHRWI